MGERHAIVVGAGVGGLAAAIRLASRGLKVTVLERQPTPGGKMRQLLPGGRPVDSGPTVFTMRWVLEEIFQEAGAELSASLALRPLPVLARHAWGADRRLDLFADPKRSAEAIGDFAGADEARRFAAFCAQARRVYDTLEAPYIRSQRPTLGGLALDLGPRGLAVLAGLGPFASLWRALSRHFRDPRLRQLFGRYATYCGGSPWLAPATLMLVAQVEMDGVWAVEGGMAAVARALASLAEAQGAALRYGVDCESMIVEGGRCTGVRLAGGECIAADAVVFNGDAQALATGLLGEGARGAVPVRAAGDRSLSAVTWSMLASTRGFDLEHHNVFFDDDYASEFEDIFRHRRLPRRGTVYVCAPDRPGLADGGPERLLALVNAPPMADVQPLTTSEIDACESSAFGLLARSGLLVERATAHTIRTTPLDFHRLFPATGGALYGMATHGWMSSFTRPGSASRLPGLYLAGGSVHPGPGVPMAAMSGRLAAATLLAHLDSTSRSGRVRISGGTSMP